MAGGTPEGLGAILGEGPARRLILPSLEAIPGLLHAFTVRGSDTAAVLSASAGAALPLSTLRQVHGAGVQTIGEDGRAPAGAPPAATGETPQGDALLTRRPGLALGVYVADCAPILICDPQTRGIAAVHAGWRGTVAGVLPEAIGALCDAFGARAGDLRLGIGPCIGPCCFEVGDEVVEALLDADPGAATCVVDGARRRIDLVEANRRQAVACGVDPDLIEAAGLCTMCRGDLLESYRRGRGRAGRMAALIAWKP
ncbi:MAG TPA: peptidoglycan editing factor PgeF [Candidatus Polarisedimenticolia bacterium]|nr:peptidoglycan editing factor PgeF [Candidatus Polarisedimenticolia bacterium]